VTATANSGFSFVNWTQNGSQVNAPANYTFTLSSNVTLVANFTATTSSSASIFTTQTPVSVNLSDGPTTNYELGTLFQSSIAGQITAIRFWKASNETGTHTGHIWSAGGTLLATAAFSGETASGWQQVSLSPPLSIATNMTYVVSVNTGATFYVATDNGLASSVVNGPLSTVVGNNGVYGSPGAFPTNTYLSSNYFRDVVLTYTPPPPQPPTVSSANFSTQTALGAVVGQVNATNSPTSFAITSGNGNNYFTISSTGVISISATIAVPAGTYSLQVTATNNAETSAPATIGISLTAPAFGDPVPSNRRIDWTYTGVPGGIPSRTTICATFSPGATAAAITSAINACNNGVVFLNAGTYSSASLGGTIQVYKSNVTLRGAGADQTILTGQAVIYLGNGSNVSLGTAITGGATKGSTTFTVASTANLSAGTMIEIDRDDDTSLIVNTGGQGGGTRNMTQVNMITGVSGNTITVRNPFIYDFSTGNPKVKYYFGGITQNSGVENLKVDHTGFTSGGYNFMHQYCDSCWLKGIESAFATGYHFVVLGTLNSEIRDSYIHDGGSGPDNSGLSFYGNYRYGGNSSAKIENNIFNKDFPAIELNNSSSGFYIGYNYSYGSPSQFGTNLVTWTYDDGHAPFNIMNLYEGNIGEMWGMDGYFGGSGYGTVLRNYFTGFNPNYGVTGDAVQLKRLGYYYNMVGNILGSTNQNPVAYDSGCGGPVIYQLGYPNIGNCSTSPWDGFMVAGGYPDPKVAATLLRWGNYDYFNKAARFVASEIPAGVNVPSNQTIPNSYYYSSKPAWWPASIAWPPIGADVTGGNGDTSGHVNKIPAQVCWETRNLLTGGAFNASACYGA
jgi:hypothetical protein